MQTNLSKPSKQFIIRGSIATSIVVIILVIQTDWFRSLFNKKPLLNITDARVGDLVALDTNSNGIPDWEEKLWGLDPTKLYTNGRPNADIIAEKKAALGISEENEGPLNETDRIARELFSTTTALSETASAENIGSIGKTIGEGVGIEPVNQYSSKDIKTVATSSQSLVQYTQAIDSIITKYQKEYADITTVVTALETGDYSGVADLSITAITYQSLVKELRNVAVPIGIAKPHLDLMNGFAGMAQGFDLMTQIEDNSIVGLQGLAFYRKYYLLQQSALFDIGTYLQQYGILEL